MFEILLSIVLTAVGAVAQPREPATARVELVLVPRAAVPAKAPLVTITLQGDQPGSKALQRKAPGIEGSQFFDLPEGLWTVAATADGWWAPAAKVVVRKGTPRREEIGFYRAARLNGRLEVERGDSLPGELGIEVFQPFVGPGPNNPRPKPVSSDTISVRCPVTADSFQCIGPAGTWDLKVRVPRHIAHYLWGQRLRSGAPLSLGTLALRRGASVVGWVSTGGVAPQSARCKVELRPLQGAMTSGAGAVERELSASTETNPRGFFELQGVAPGTYKIRATLGAAASAEFFPVRVFDGSETTLQQPLALAAPITLTVRVNPATDLEQRPWRVQVGRLGQTPGHMEMPVPARAGQGGWHLDKLAPGDYEVDVLDGQGTPWASQLVALPSASETVFDLDFVEVRGTVTLGGKPLAATLTFGGTHGVPHHEMVSDDKGRFEGYLSQEKSWLIEVKASDPRLETTLERVKVRRSGGSVAKLRLDLPDGRIEGRVTDEQGNAATALVSVREAGHRTTLMTDEEGKFSGRGWATGPATLQARGQGMESEEAWVQVDEKTGTPPVHLVLRKNQTVEGWVLGPSGPVAGALLLASAPGGVDGRTSTDVVGHFSLRVPASAGALDVEVMAPGYPLQARRVQLGAGDLRLLLDPEGGTLVMDFNHDQEVIVEENGVELSGWSLTQWALGNGWRPGSSSQLEVPQVETGQYVLCQVGFSDRRAFTAGNRSVGRCSSGTLAAGGTLALKVASP